MNKQQKDVVLTALATIPDWQTLSIHELALTLTTPVEVTPATYIDNPDPAPTVPDYGSGFPSELADVATILASAGANEDAAKLMLNESLVTLAERTLASGDLTRCATLVGLLCTNTVGLSAKAKASLQSILTLTCPDPNHPTQVLSAPAVYETPVETAAKAAGIEPFAINGDLIQEATT